MCIKYVTGEVVADDNFGFSVVSPNGGLPIALYIDSKSATVLGVGAASYYLGLLYPNNDSSKPPNGIYVQTGNPAYVPGQPYPYELLYAAVCT